MSTKDSDVVLTQKYTTRKKLFDTSIFSEQYALQRSSIVKVLNGIGSEITESAKTIIAPYWDTNPASGVVNTSNDDINTDGAVNALSQSKLSFPVLRQNSAYGIMDVTAEKVGAELSQAVEANTSNLMYKREMAMFNALAGVTGADTSRVRNISQTSGASTLTYSEINKTKAILGHMRNQLKYVIGNSEAVTYFNEKLATDARDVNKTTDGNRFAGMEVIDSPHVSQYKIEAGDPLIGTGDIAEGDVIATIYMVGDGLIGVGNGTPVTPIAYQRKEEAGNGGGYGIMWDRETYAMTVAGFSWVPATGASDISDFADPANWTYHLEDKKVCPLVALTFRIPAADVTTL